MAVFIVCYDCPRVSSLTHASLPIRSALHARGADAHEGADQVLAGHALGVAVVQALGAFVLVWVVAGETAFVPARRNSSLDPTV